MICFDIYIHNTMMKTTFPRNPSAQNGPVHLNLKRLYIIMSLYYTIFLTHHINSTFCSHVTTTKRCKLKVKSRFLVRSFSHDSPRSRFTSSDIGLSGVKIELQALRRLWIFMIGTSRHRARSDRCQSAERVKQRAQTDSWSHFYKTYDTFLSGLFA